MESKKTLIEFLEAWKNQDFEKMYNLCQLTWKDNHKLNHIEQLFSGPKPKHYKIVSFSVLSDVLNRYMIEVQDPDGNKYISVVNLICEVAPYKAKGYGTWGINPPSVLKFTQVIKKSKPKVSKASVKNSVKKR